MNLFIERGRRRVPRVAAVVGAEWWRVLLLWREEVAGQGPAEARQVCAVVQPRGGPVEEVADDPALQEEHRGHRQHAPRTQHHHASHLVWCPLSSDGRVANKSFVWAGDFLFCFLVWLLFEMNWEV